MTQQVQHDMQNLNIPFIKMNGAGNDFIILDERKAPLNLTIEDIQLMADRQRGIGCDQLIVLSKAEGVDAFMTFYNADGSISGACGNGTRCIGGLLMREHYKKQVKLGTSAGILEAFATDTNGYVEVNMGQPRFNWDEIPLAQSIDDTASIPLNLLPEQARFMGMPAAASMGNPHVVFFVKANPGLNYAELGALLEHHELFPERVNVNFAQIISQSQIRLVVWERGAGLTKACGTGACATAVSAMRRGLTGRKVLVQLPGGALTVEWQYDGTVLMTGPISFDGEGIVAEALGKHAA